MTIHQARLQEAALRRIAAVKATPALVAMPMGGELVSFFKQSVQKRQKKLEKIAAAWETLIPDMFTDHCALSSLQRGSLTVLVDSSSHLYELKQLLLAGVEKQLLLACRTAGLTKVVLKLGRWYEERDGRKDPRF